MQILTRDDLRLIAPSIFARSPYHTMTPRYRAAYTADVVDSLERNGFFPVRASPELAPRHRGPEVVRQAPDSLPPPAGPRRGHGHRDPGGGPDQLLRWIVGL